MGIEIDFLAVGDASKSGDAIAVRFGNLYSNRREEQTIITIDGGTKESGADLVEHIKKHYGTTIVDYAFLTHPDGDHASGMSEILENLTVRTVLMHRPWNHSNAIHNLFDDDRITPNSIRERSKENLAAAHEIEKLAIAKGIKILEPFAGVGTKDGSIKVLGPSLEYYREVLSKFDYMPELIEAKSAENFSIFNAAARAIKWIAERWDQDLLVEPEEDATSPENNSSMILLITTGNGTQHLLTGDAGVPALSKALDYAADNSISLSNLTFIQTPHHGSKRNIGPSVLDRLFGGIKPLGTTPDKTTFISAAKEGEPKHPNKRVTNAFLRRGVKPFVTAGKAVRHHDDAPPRVGWSTANPIPFHNQVEDDE
jgi:beta-lactamase superfamily II metal-dependent hydrolase